MVPASGVVDRAFTGSDECTVGADRVCVGVENDVLVGCISEAACCLVGVLRFCEPSDVGMSEGELTPGSASPLEAGAH